MKQQTRAALTAALLEAFFVVLGVALAFAVNEWRESRADRRQAAAALESITEEVRSNREATAAALEYHGALVERITQAAAAGRTPEIREFTRGFVSPARVLRTAWEAAAQTGATTHMAYDQVLELSALYAQQDRYEAQALSVGELIYGELLRGGPGAIVANSRNLSSILRAFAYREHELLELYDATLKDLESELTEH